MTSVLVPASELTARAVRPPAAAPVVTRERQPARPRRFAGRLDLILALASTTLCTVVLAIGIGRYPALGGDEGIYTNQADSLLHGRVTLYTYTYDHPFFGWLQLAPFAWLAQALHLGGDASVVNTRAVMVGYAAATLMLTYGVLRRLRASSAACTVAVLLLGLSPLFIDEARQVYLDNIAIVWVLAALFAALNPAQRLWRYGLSGVLLAIAILSKETVLLFLPAVAYLVWTRSHPTLRRISLAAFATLGGLVVTCYPVFALLRNELFPGSDHVSLWTNGILYQLANRAGSGALWQAHSARAALVDGWAYYDRWLLYGGIAAAVATLAIKRLRAVGIAVLCWAIPVIKPGGYLPAMYIVAVLPFVAMGAAGMVDAVYPGAIGLLRRVRRRTVPAARVHRVVGALVVLALASVVLWRDVDTGLPLVNSDAVRPQTQALAYLDRVAGHDDNILTDPAFWLDLTRAGHGSVADPWHGAIVYYQFDLDPQSSIKHLPQGWQDLDYVLFTKAMSDNMGYLQLTGLQAAVHHSTVLATFGTGDSQVQVLRVQPTPYNTFGTARAGAR